MRNFFERFEGATWPAPGRLHVYVRGNAVLRAAVGRYQQRLRETGVADEHGLGLQDPEFVHCTVQMLQLYRHEVSAEQIQSLIRQVREALTVVEPFAVVVGPPAAGEHAVELWVLPEADAEWERLVQVVRQAASDALGAEVVPELGANARPHTSLGYGIGDGDSGAITSALRGVRQGLVQVPVAEVELAAVTQHPRSGCFTWETVARIPVGADDDEELAADPGTPAAEPPELAGAAEALVRAGTAGRWRPSEADVQAVLLLREHYGRIWAVDGRGWPASAAVSAAADGIEPLIVPDEIRAATAEAHARALALPVSPELRSVLEAAARYEPQPASLGGWREVFGPILTGDWSF